MSMLPIFIVVSSPTKGPISSVHARCNCGMQIIKKTHPCMSVALPECIGARGKISTR